MIEVLLTAWRAWGLGPALANIASRLWSALTGNLWRAGFALALTGLGIEQVRIEGLTLRPHIGAFGITLFSIKGYRPALAGAQAELAEVKAAQPKAAAAQAAVNHQPAVLSAAIAKVSDDDATTYYDKGRAAGAAYAAVHAADGLCAAPGDRLAGDAAVPGGDHPAPLHDGAGDAAGMVALSRADFDQLAANSLRLAKVHQDAESLIAAGVAVAP